ncbi:hypothetical protein C9426_28090, partial [Serratia sp. S1B]
FKTKSTSNFDIFKTHSINQKLIYLAKPLLINKFLSASPPMDTYYRPFLTACKLFLALFDLGVCFFIFFVVFADFIRIFA